MTDGFPVPALNRDLPGDAMMLKSVELEVERSVALLTLRVPPVNALDERSLHDLKEAIDEVQNDAAIRVVIIASGINGIFCSGGDLKYWPRTYPKQAHVVSEAGRVVFERIEQLTKPSIAAIEGRVIGDGLSLALASDFRLASPESTFRLPEIDYGFIPGWGTIGRLLDQVGKPSTTELLFLGEEINATRAQAMGLVSHIRQSGDLMPFATGLAGRIAAKPPKALRYAKAALRRGTAHQSRSESSTERDCFAAVWGGREWQEGINRLFGAKAQGARQKGVKPFAEE